MEPPKVEVSLAGCIMVPTASPQGRGVPIPNYEASLVNITSLYTNSLYWHEVLTVVRPFEVLKMADILSKFLNWGLMIL